VSKISDTKLIRFQIPSDLAQAPRILAVVQKELTRQQFSEHSLFAIRLALEEALVNAIKHGNRLNPRKKVLVEADITPARAKIVVEDQGLGFNRKKVPDPRREENLTKCTGRGVLLIESYMNQVKWSRGGRRVEMIKKNEQDTLPRNTTVTE
jgi:serine/threonine-protein kinase RsbW